MAALRDQAVNLYSDLLVHDMGTGLADGVTQGQAGPREFRTAPLWGLGQRLFFLHDGRTSDLLEAIRAHQSGSFTFDASEANEVIKNFNRLLREPEAGRPQLPPVAVVGGQGPLPPRAPRRQQPPCLGVP